MSYDNTEDKTKQYQQIAEYEAYLKVAIMQSYKLRIGASQCIYPVYVIEWGLFSTKPSPKSTLPRLVVVAPVWYD